MGRSRLLYLASFAVAFLLARWGMSEWRMRGEPPVARAMAKRMRDPELDSLLRAATEGLTYDESKKRGAQLSARGVLRLTREQHLQRVGILAKVASMPGQEALCAAMWTGRVDEQNFFEALGQLDSTEQSQFARLVRDATLAELRNEPRAIIATDEQIGLIFQLPSESMGAADSARYWSAIEDGANVKRQDACWAMRALLTSMLALEEPARTNAATIFGRMRTEPPSDSGERPSR